MDIQVDAAVYGNIVVNFLIEKYKDIFEQIYEAAKKGESVLIIKEKDINEKDVSVMFGLLDNKGFYVTKQNGSISISWFRHVR